MSTVLGSARRSTASAFDFIGDTFAIGSKLVNSASRGVDILARKVEQMDDQSLTDTRIASTLYRREAIARAVKDHVDLLEEMHYASGTKAKFDRPSVTAATFEELTRALDAK